LPHPSFHDSILANLAYWQNRVNGVDDPALRELAMEGQNIYRAVEFGLALPDTWRSAARLMLDLHYFIEHSGNRRPWQLLLRRALEQCAEEDADLKLHLLDRSGGYYRQDRDWDSSLAAHEEEIALARSLGRKDSLAQALYNLSILYWRRRQYDKAAEYAQEALAGFLEVEATERQLGGAYSILGLIAYGRGEPVEAVGYHLQSVSYFRKTEFSVLLARSLVNLALAQEAEGQIDPALATYQEALSILEDTDYEMEKTRIELSLGSLLFNMNRFDGAEEAYLRAYSPYLKQSGLVYFQGLATNNLGNVYLEQGRLKEAEAMLRESLSLWERANAPLQTANTTGALGKVLAAQGRDLEARDCFDQALAGVAEFPEDGWAKQLVQEYREERDKLLNKSESTG
jgi:tetratricopeptide (TPR) repeat protein